MLPAAPSNMCFFRYTPIGVLMKTILSHDNTGALNVHLCYVFNAHSVRQGESEKPEKSRK